MVPFLDLKREHESIKGQINHAIERVIYNQSNFILGKEVELFEKEFAKYCEKNYGVGVNSGTDALELTLMAAGIQRGDEVITTVNTAIPTAMAIANVGGIPVFTDVGSDFLINPDDLEKRITKKTKAIIPVHLYGLACDMVKINEIAKKYNLSVIEDCCQAHGAEYEGKKVPISEIGCFSFYPSKNIGALGDGGIVITNKKNISDKIRLLRNFGQEDVRGGNTRGRTIILGGNSRLDEIQAAVLGVKLKKLDVWNNERQKIAKRYTFELEGYVKTPEFGGNRKHAYHLYVIRTNERDRLMLHLKERGIQTLVHYPIPLHMQEAFSSLGYVWGDFPNAERFSYEIVSLPLFPGMTESEIDEVIHGIKSFK